MLIPARTVVLLCWELCRIQTAFFHALKRWREQGNDFRVAETLWWVSESNRVLHLNEEGIQQAKEALGIYKRLDDISGQARALTRLAHLLYDDGQLAAAEGAASQVIDHFSGKDEQFHVCRSYRILGYICRSKDRREEAANHLKAALGIASSFNWRPQLIWIHDSLATLAFDEGRFDDAHAHIEHAKSYAVNDAHSMGLVVEQQALLWYQQRKFQEAMSAASHAADVFEGLGATKCAGDCRTLLREIEQAMEQQV
jgi:tetratricopeptide (TPR) repeat protein